MGRTHVGALAILAVVLTAAAALLYRQQQPGGSDRFEPHRLYPDLTMGRIARIEIENGDEPIALERRDDGDWGLVERGGYPVDEQKLNRLVLSLAEMKATDRRTQDAEIYDALGVGEEPEKGRVRLIGDDGEPIADVHIGSSRRRRTYVRTGEDPWVYEVNRNLNVETSPRNWLQRELLKVDASNLQRIEIEHHKKTTESLTLARTGADSFELRTQIPEGYKTKTAALTPVSRALSSVSLNDVLPADDPRAAEFEPDATYRAFTKDGLIYRVAAGKIGDKHYLKLSTDYDAALATAVDDEPTTAGLTGEPPEDIRETLDAVGEKQKWLFEVSQYVYDNVAKKLSDLIEKP